MSDWYYAVDNEQKGPINEAELKEHLAGNKVPPDTLVWKDGMDNWTPANQVPAFSFRQPPIPAKVQPSTVDHNVTKAVNPNAPVVTSAATTPGTNLASTTPVDLSNIVGTPEALEVDFNDAEKNKVWGILAYVPFLFWVPLVAAKDSPFAKYHANQGLALFLSIIVSIFALTLFSYVPIIGFVFDMLRVLVDLAALILLILGIVNAAAGKCVPLPVIGGIKLIK